MVNPSTPLSTHDDSANRLAAERAARELADRQIASWRLADAKRQRAPRWLGGIAAIGAGVVAFSHKVNQELSNVFSLVIADRGKLSKLKNENSSVIPANVEHLYTNTHLNDIARRYMEHGATQADSLIDLTNAAASSVRTNDLTKTTELVRISHLNFYNKTKDLLRTTEQKIENLNRSGQATPQQIADIWERAYLHALQFRDEFRKTANREFIRELKDKGDYTFSFSTLNRSKIIESALHASAVAAAVGATVYQILRTITRESDPEKQQRVAALAVHLDNSATSAIPATDIAQRKNLSYAAQVVAKESDDFRARLSASREMAAQQSDERAI